MDPDSNQTVTVVVVTTVVVSSHGGTPSQEGMNFLRRAQVMYHHRPQAVKEQCEERCENNYTMTM